MPVLLQTILLLTLSNVFMTFAWYVHLKNLNNKPWLVAALVSRGIALLSRGEMTPRPDLFNPFEPTRCGLRVLRESLFLYCG